MSTKLLEQLNAARPILAALFAALWVVDAAATVKFVSDYGSEAEANLLMRALIDSSGLTAFAFAKAAALGLWLSVHNHASPWLHVALLMVMVPVVTAGSVIAWGTP